MPTDSGFLDLKLPTTLLTLRSLSRVVWETVILLFTNMSQT